MATATYGTAYWDDVQNTLKTDCSMMEKVSNQKLLYMFPNYSSYLPCVFHGIACLMVCGNGRQYYSDIGEQETHWIFAN